MPSWPTEDHVCADCGLAYQELSPAQAIDVVRAVPDALRAALTTVPPTLLRQRPAHGGWSIAEYLCHLRDVFVTYTIRIHRARFEDQPALEPMLNDLRAQRLRYNERNCVCIMEELEANAAGFREETARVRPQDLNRAVIRQPGEL